LLILAFRAIQESLDEYRRHNIDDNAVVASSHLSDPTQSQNNLSIDNAPTNQLANGHIPQSLNIANPSQNVNDEIQMAIRLSQQEKEEEDRRRLEEENILEQVLKLSMTEK